MENTDVTPRLTSNHDSDVTLEASSGESDGYSDYVEPCKNSPTTLDNTPELAGHIHKLHHMHKVDAANLWESSQPIEIFIHPSEVNPTELVNNETAPAKIRRDNSASPPHYNQLTSLQSPLTDAVVVL